MNNNSSSGNSQPLPSGTPPQLSPFSGSCVEKELDACFIRALHLLHSTDPDAKNELRRLVEQQIELTTASNKSHTAKPGFALGEAKKQVGAARFKEKSPQVVTTTTTLVSGGVNTMHMEDTLSPLSAKLSNKEVFSRLSSSSSNDDTPIPANPRRVAAKSSSPKRMKLTTPRDLLGESDDSLDENSTGNDSFDDNGKESEKPDHAPHHPTPPTNPSVSEPTRPIRTAHKMTFLSSVDKISLPHSKTGHHGAQRGSTLLTHKKLLPGSRLKGKSALNKQLLKKFK